MSTITGKANQMQRVTCPGEQHFESVTIIAGAKKKVNKLWQQKKELIKKAQREKLATVTTATAATVEIHKKKMQPDSY